jgi:Icc-related predicted phosphoesterase
MKIAVCSDLHLEFTDIDLKNDDNANVLILSGDICVAKDIADSDSKRGSIFRDFFRRCSNEFPHVIYIMGNHEHYNGDFQTSTGIYRKELFQYDNVYFLDKEVKVIDDITFIGGTLWTDMNKEDPITLFDISHLMNDFRIVTNSARKVGSSDKPARFCPEDALEDHKLMLKFISDSMPTDNSKVVVVGHHAPSKQSMKPKYKEDYHMNGGYSSDLESFIIERPQIKLWTHGHTHDVFDYMIGSTRVFCNPRGYEGYEDSADEFKLLTVEV